MTTPRLLDEIKIDDGGFFEGWRCSGLIKKRTVIFGRNGSGKSTLVRHLRGKHHSESTSSAAVAAETDLDVLVFNEDYVRENLGGVFEGSALSPALFVTGSVNVETEAKIEKATQTGHRLTEEISKAKEETGERKKAYDDACINARDGVRALQKSFSNITRVTAENELRGAEPSSAGDDANDREVLWRDPSAIPEPVRALPKALINIDLSRANEVLARDVDAVASEALSGLTKEQRDWVEEGAKLHDARDTCLFCENGITQERSGFLAALRTSELLELQRDLKTLSDEVSGQKHLVESLVQELPQIVKRINTPNLDLSEVTKETEVANSDLEALSERLAKKHAEPNTTVEMPSIAVPETPHFDALCLIVQEKNQAWERERTDRESEQRKSLERCLGRLRSKHIPEIDTTQVAWEKAQERLTSLEAEESELNVTLGSLEAERLQTDDAAPLARRLTQALRSYLGHDELAITVEVENGATGFALNRGDGRRAAKLSEGERSAISLLYFITSLQESERSSKLSETCVVLDDPVSSLDGQSIRNAFHFILNALIDDTGNENVGQFVIFTHNEAFFGLWREKLTKNMKQLGERDALLRLDARQSAADSRRKPVLVEFPRGSIQYRSEYYRLFDQVVGEVEQQSNFIDQGIANVTRRLMESFARWKSPNADNLSDSLKKLVEQGSAESHVDRFGSVFQFLQSGSHFEEIDIEIEAESVSNYRNDVVACLALMRATDEAHFEGMFHAVRATGEGTEVAEQFARICGVQEST